MALGTGESVRETLERTVAATSSGAGADPGGSPSPSAPASAPAPAPASAPSGVTGATIPASNASSQPPAIEAPKPGALVRGADGKFVKPDAGSPQAPPAEGQTKAPDSTAPGKDGAPDTGAPILPPATWGKEARVDWATLPRPVQAELERVQKGRDRLFQQERQRLAQVQQGYTQLDQVIGPRREALIAQGGVVPTIARLFQLSDYAAQNPGAFIQWMAKDRGIDLAQLVAGTPPAPAVDPQFQTMQQKLDQLQGVVMQLGGAMRGNAQTQETQAQTATLQAIQRWAAEADADGQPKRPYFERLENHVNILLPQVYADNPGISGADALQAAYDQAVYAHPETRQAITQQAENKRLAATRQAAQKAAEQAQLAGSSITGSTAPTGGSVPAKTVGEELRRVIAAKRGMAA